MEKSNRQAIEVLSLAIKEDEQGVRDVLKRNGVKTDLIETKKELSKVFINSLAKSRSLAEDYGKYLRLKTEEMVGVDGVGVGMYTPNFEVNPLFTNDLSVLPKAKQDSFQTYTSDKEEKGGSSFIDTLSKITTTASDLAALYKDVVVDDVEREQAIAYSESLLEEEKAEEKKNLLIYGSMSVLAIGLIVGIIYYARKK